MMEPLVNHHLLELLGLQEQPCLSVYQGTHRHHLDRRISGRLNTENGGIKYEPGADPEIDDLLDDVAELVLQKSGQVIIVPANRMPSDTGLAATYRF